MKMINLSMPIALVAVIAVCFCVGCTESHKLTGTAEETNEFAFVVSSSSEEESSSSECSESSSSSEKGVAQPESSGANNKARSSSSSTLEESSSSLETLSSSSLSSSSVVESSSSKAPPQGGINSSCSTVKQNSLDYYVEVLGLNRNQVYEGVMAARSTKENDSDTGPGEAMATEFDGPWPHPFVKQNVDALGYFFPDAAEEYAGLIDSIKAGLTDGDCKLYMMNVSGSDKSMGFVIADVAKDVVTVLDIARGGCPVSTANKTIRFLFRYCGEIDWRPEINHVEVDVPEDLCPDFNPEEEWVR